jgi:hypothetical protein
VACFLISPGIKASTWPAPEASIKQSTPFRSCIPARLRPHPGRLDPPLDLLRSASASSRLLVRLAHQQLVLRTEHSARVLVKHQSGRPGAAERASIARASPDELPFK